MSLEIISDTEYNLKSTVVNLEYQLDRKPTLVIIMTKPIEPEASKDSTTRIKDDSASN